MWTIFFIYLNYLIAIGREYKITTYGNEIVYGMKYELLGNQIVYGNEIVLAKKTPW